MKMKVTTAIKLRIQAGSWYKALWTDILIIMDDSISIYADDEIFNKFQSKISYGSVQTTQLNMMKTNETGDENWQRVEFLGIKLVP
jgi:hypothetical protein